MMRRASPTLAVLVLLAGAATRLCAQQQDTDLATPTLHTESRLVVEDVLVMDKDGNPVRGLPPSAFHLTDNGKPQQIRSVEEGSSAAPAPTASPLPLGTFSNASSADSSSATEVLLIDTDDIALTDQMFLLTQLKKAIQAMPAGLAASIFSVRNGRVAPLLLNTTDREALMRTANDVLPIQNHAIDSRFQSAVDQLMSVAALLQQSPGRKNLLWFAGEFPLVSAGEVDLTGRDANFAQREHIIHQVQEALAEARISVYPVEVRGVITQGMYQPTEPSQAPTAAAGPNPAAMSEAGLKRGIPDAAEVSDADRRSEMRSLAQTTGGRAYFQNDLAQEIDQAFELGKSAYTLSYTPSPYTTDESWHRIVITVDGDYTLSYRRGYLATWTGATDQAPRYTVVAGARQRVDPNATKPLLFQARLVPAADAQHVTIHLAIPLDGISFPFQDGVYHNDLTVSASAYDAGGRVKDGKRQELETNLTPQQYAADSAADRKIATTMQMVVPKGAKYLLLVVRDTRSQRTGSLLLQTRVLATLPTATAGTP